MRFVSLFLCFAVLPYCSLAQVPGGIGEPKTPENQDIDDVKIIASQAIQQSFTQKTNIAPKEFYVVSYATQVVAGTNYFAKVRIDVNTYAHLRVFKPLPNSGNPPQLHSVQTGKSFNDPITYFAADDIAATTKSPLGASGSSGSSEASTFTFDFSIVALFFVTVFAFFLKN